RTCYRYYHTKCRGAMNQRQSSHRSVVVALVRYSHHCTYNFSTNPASSYTAMPFQAFNAPCNPVIRLHRTQSLCILHSASHPTIGWGKNGAEITVATGYAVRVASCISSNRSWVPNLISGQRHPSHWLPF
ncbi:unnamed protein product, partial [Ectocarpus sp. 12 AP-2014]